MTLKLLVVEIMLFHRIGRKTFRGPMRGRFCCDKMSYLGGNRSCPLGLQCPISVHPTWKKASLVLSKDKTKARVQSFCFIGKLSLLEPRSQAACPHGC